MSLERLLELHELSKKQAQEYPKKRFLYERVASEQGKHFVGIAGPRGSGKTVILRQYALEHKNAFYLSADSLEYDDDLWRIIGDLNEHYGYDTILLDEIHFLPNASSILKRLYDFRGVRVIFSSSVALAMHESIQDLSRRVRMLMLYPFSFREYVFFKEGTSLEKLELDQLLNRKWTKEHLLAGQYFDDYLRGKLLPFSLDEPEPLVLLGNIVEKIITKDIPHVVRLAIDELDTIKRLLRFVGSSGVDGINYTSLSQNIGITKYKAEQYVDCLEKAFVLSRVLPAGTNVLREPKVLMAPPYRLLYADYDKAVGCLREDFCGEALKQAGISFHYLKSTRGAKTPDFLIETPEEKLVIEVGGKGKGREQFKGVKADRKVIFAHKLVPDEKRLPLFLLGYLA